MFKKLNASNNIGKVVEFFGKEDEIELIYFFRLHFPEEIK